MGGRNGVGLRLAGALLASAMTMVQAGCGSSSTTTMGPPPPPSAPTLAMLSVSTGDEGTTTSTVTLTGTNFSSPATLSFSGTGITANNVTVTSTTTITATFTIAGNAALGPQTVFVTTGAGTSANVVQFTVNPPAPTLTMLSTSIGFQGNTVAETLTGTNFIAGATTVNLTGPGVTVMSTNVTSATTLTVSFVLAGNASVGMRSVTVTTAGGTSGNQTFTVETPPVTVVVAPQNASIRDAGAMQAYTATGYFADGSVQDLTPQAAWTSTNTGVASVSTAGVVTSGTLAGGQSAGYTSISGTVSGVKGVSILSVTSHTGNGFAGAFTQHNDNQRTGQNLNETALTPAVVGNTATFGKKFAQPVDGFIYAQPLYVPSVAINGKGTHNTVYVATEGDSVYAFDADSNAGANANPLWHASLISTMNGATQGETTVNSNNDIGCSDLIPQVGITGTPVIDPSTNTMYVEAKSKEMNGTFIHRLHALDITTGSEKAGSPVTIAATVPGTGDGGASVTFDALKHLERPGLLLVNGVVYLGYASHCDITPYHGWVFAYDAGTLVQRGVINLTPNGGLGGVWMAGAGLAADGQGNLFTVTGNGTFESSGTVTDYGDSIVKLSLASGKLLLTDYFTPYNQSNLDAGDVDLGAGGVLLLPDQAGGNAHELVEAGKDGTVYVVDRDQMSANNMHYCATNCSSDPQIVQELQHAIGGLWSMPAYWNGNVYVWGAGDALQQYTLSSGKLSKNAAASSVNSLGFPGATPAISANGNLGAIVWAIDSTKFGPPHQQTAMPAVLYAFDATNVENELYDTTMAANGRDTAGNAVKFTVPTIANGKVYIGTQTELDVYGTLP